MPNIPIPYSFLAGTVIDPDQMNANFQSLSMNAVADVGGDLTSPVITGGATITGAVTVNGALTVSGTIASTQAPISAPYTAPTWKLYDDGSQWAHLVYGNDAILRVTFAHTGVGGPLLFGTSSANNGTGTFTPLMSLDGAGALALVGGLSVTGATTLTGGIGGNLSVAGTLTTGSSLVVSSGGASIAGTLQVNNVNVNTGTLTVAGATTLNSTLAVSGAVTVGSLTSNGNVSAAGYLMSGGVIYPGRVDVSSQQNSWYLGSHATYGLYTNMGLFVAGNLWVNGTSILTGLVTVSSGMNLSGLLAVNSVNVNAGNLAVTAGNLTVSGTTTLQSTLTVTGAASVGGTFTCATSGNFTWQVRTTDVVYQAGTDGFVVAYASNNASAILSTLIGRSGSSNPPTVDVTAQSALAAFEYVNVTFPVRKGDYYRVTASGGGFVSPLMWFIPLGTVTG